MRFRISQLDFRLGFRMLVKYPGLTVVGVVAIAIAIGISTAWFEFTGDMFRPRLPLRDGDRVVAVTSWDAARNAPDPRTLHDYEVWRAQVRTIRDLGAASVVGYVAVAEDGRSYSAQGAQMSASGFRVTQVAPVLGRTLLPADESPGAQPVAVIGYDLWQRLFDGDRRVLGRTVKLAGVPTTVVGVMPDGFGFPANQEIWVPFQSSATRHARGEGPALKIFGRLAPGVSLAQAQAELSAIGERTAAAFPATHRQLRPRVERYAESFMRGGLMLMSAMNLPFMLLLAVICANVATLVFARTATRVRELVTRSALGASRARLIGQLYAESLVLTAVGSVIGVTLAGFGLARGMTLFWQVQEMRPPFWFDPGLAPRTLLYAAGLTLLSALLVGAIPALKVTGRNLREGLSQTGVGTPRLRFGWISSSVIVVQVALCVVFLPMALVRAQDALGGRLETVGFPAESYLSGTIARQSEAPLADMPEAERRAFQERTAQLLREVVGRVAAGPGVEAVALATRVPGMNHPYEEVRFDGAVGPGDSAGVWARYLGVDAAFFAAMNAPMVAGRGFTEADMRGEGRVAIVDEAFVAEHLGGRNPVGRRIRYPGRDGDGPQAWYEVVGVVKDLAMNAYGPSGYQDLVQTAPVRYVGVYHPLRLGLDSEVQLFVRSGTTRAETHLPPIAAAITAIDPSLAVEDLATVEQVWAPVHRGQRMITLMMALITLIVISLSSAGIYALTSFTVSQRTREIGIRTALGAGPRRIVLTILTRALTQIGLGVAIGGALFALIAQVQSARGFAMVLGMAGLMAAVGLAACIVPASRALRIQPSDAMRADA
jgi:putative ABC transport system permease protein